MKALLWKLIRQWRDATTTEAAWIARDQIDIELDKFEAAATQEPIGEVSGNDWSTALLWKDHEPGSPVYAAVGAAPVPNAELAEALEDLMSWQVKNVKRWHNSAYDNAARVLKKLEAGAAPVPEGWQPIETAPKDGLQFRAYSKDLIDLDFNPNGSVECCWDGAEFVGCVWDGQQDAWYGKAISFTHWMPIPSAPKEQTP